MRNFILLGLCAAIVWFGPCLHGQPLDKYNELIAKEKEALATFLDSKRSKKDRLAATQQFYRRSESAPELLAIVADKSEDDEIRIAAVTKCTIDDQAIDVLSKVLADPMRDNEEVAMKMVEAMHHATPGVIGGMASPEGEQRIRATLRQLLNDPRAGVRFRACNALVSLQDPVALNVLEESLKARKDFPIPMCNALNLLSGTGSDDHLGVLRRFIYDKDPGLQSEAVSRLTSDPESRPRIMKILNNPKSHRAVRKAAVEGLAFHDPKKFPSYALPMLLDAKEDPKIRLAVMDELPSLLGEPDIKRTIQIRIAATIKKIAGDTKLKTEDEKELRRNAKEQHEYIQKEYPGLLK